MRRRVCSKSIIVATMSLAVVACGDGKPATKSGEKPATVSAPKKETELTTVTLTTDAEKRLGVVTAPVEQRPVTRTRTVGGEIDSAIGRGHVNHGTGRRQA